MTAQRLKGVIESILFVCGESVSVDSLAAALDVTLIQIEQALYLLETEYAQEGRGLHLKRFANQVQIASKADYAQEVEQVLQPAQHMTLSQSALETLVIIAYRQPVTRQEIEAVRGVKCDYSIQSLMQKDLIRESGRKETLGRPILYGTTERFLSHFGLKSLEDLPVISKPDTPPEPAE